MTVPLNSDDDFNISTLPMKFSLKSKIEMFIYCHLCLYRFKGFTKVYNVMLDMDGNFLKTSIGSLTYVR